MRIINRTINRNQANGSYTLFVFEFTNQVEFEAYLDSLYYCAEQLPEERTRQTLLDIVEKLEQHCKGCYDRTDVELYTVLTPEDMARLVVSMTGVMWMYEDFNRMLDDLFEGLDGICEPATDDE